MGRLGQSCPESLSTETIVDKDCFNHEGASSLDTQTNISWTWRIIGTTDGNFRMRCNATMGFKCDIMTLYVHTQAVASMNLLLKLVTIRVATRQEQYSKSKE